jgi:methionine-rich copper-binding protein CopC
LALPGADYGCMRLLTVTQRAGTAVVGVLTACLAAVAPAAPAWAHAKLTSTIPATNNTVAEAVSTITLTFNQPELASETWTR